jgi:YD repeat-containing protein
VFTRKHFEVFEFDSAGRLVGAGDQFDNMTTVTYDAGGLADFMEDEAGRRLDFGWDGGRLVSVSDDLAAPAGPRSVQLAYNGAGELTSFTDVGGGVWSFTYLGGHLLGDVRDPRHHGGGPDEVVRNTYDHLGRVVAQVDEEGQTMRLDYFTPEPEWTTVTLPSGMQRIDRYEDGVCVGRTYAPGTALEQQVDFVRDPGTLVLDKVTNAAGEETLFESDERGNRIKATDPSGRVTRWTYNSFDQVTSVSVGETAAPLAASTANVVTSTVAYNSDGLPTVMVDAVGTGAEATTTLEYDTVHREDLVAVVDGRGKRWEYDYDPDTGDLVEAVDPVGGSSTMAYNGIGWLTSVVAPKGHEPGATPADWTTAFEHDDWGRVVAQVDPLANRVETTFDANGNVTSTETGLSATVTAGDVTTYAYDAVDRLATVDPPGPGARTYSYDADGRRTGFVNELGGTWGYAYDDLGRLVSQTAPESLPSVYGYDEASRLVSVTQPGGNCAATPAVDCVTYSYDPAGRPTGVDYSDPATPDITGIVYDAVGRRTAASRAGDTEAWAWDGRSRLVSHTDVNGRATTYGWDDTGNLVSIGYPGQSTPLTRAFDDAGQLVSVTDWASRTTTFDYDGNGNWESTVFPTSSQNTDVYAYDRADRMVGVTWKRGTATLGSLAYAPRDAKGLVTSVTGTGSAASAGQVWDYDTRDRLVDTGSEEFGFDAATNLVDADGVLQVFDPAQRLCWTSDTATGGDCGTPPADATTYGYDERGNRTSMTYPSGTTASYGFDAENRMTSAVLPSANWDTETRQFVTLTPARIADTTTGAGTCDGTPCAPLVADDPVAITVAGQGGVPATGATAVALTVTVTDPDGDGWLSINPVGDAAAGVVALADGQATTLNVVAKLDTNGAVTVVSDVDAEVAVDVTGYFKVASGWVPALNYWPVTPALAADSTSGTGTCDGAPCGVVPAGETDVTVAGVGGIPTTGAAAVTVTVIGQNPTAGGRLRAAPNGDASAGDISWDTGSVGASGSFTVPVNPDGTITIEAGTATTLRLSVTGYWKLPDWYRHRPRLGPVGRPSRLVDTTAEPAPATPIRVTGWSRRRRCSHRRGRPGRPRRRHLGGDDRGHRDRPGRHRPRRHQPRRGRVPGDHGVRHRPERLGIDDRPRRPRDRHHHRRRLGRHRPGHRRHRLVHPTHPHLALRLRHQRPTQRQGARDRRWHRDRSPPGTHLDRRRRPPPAARRTPRKHYQLPGVRAGRHADLPDQPHRRSHLPPPRPPRIDPPGHQRQRHRPGRDGLRRPRRHHRQHESVDPAAADGRLHRPIPRHRNRLHLPQSPPLRPSYRPIHQPRPTGLLDGGAVRLRRRKPGQLAGSIGLVWSSRWHLRRHP